MKNYLLAKRLVNELLYGSKQNRELISNKLETLIQKNESLFISIITLNQILEDESSLSKRKKILSNINRLCEKILPVETEDLSLTLGLEIELAISHSISLELIIAHKFEMNYIIDCSKDFNSQKMISVIELVLESK